MQKLIFYIALGEVKCWASDVFEECIGPNYIMVTTTQFSVQIYYYNTAMYYDLTSIAPLCTPSVEMAQVQNSRVVEAGRRRVTLAVNP